MNHEKSPKRPASRSTVAFAATVLVGAGLGWAFWPKPAPSPQVAEQPAPKAASTESPTKTITDGPVLFQRAFWKKATAADKILHAERREWGEGDSMKKWQWFLVVEPSPELLKYLRADNAFGLSPATPIPAAEGTPEWFTFNEADVETTRTPTGSMRVFFHRTKPLLYATASGAGFTAGAQQAAAKPAQPAIAEIAEIAGRLPRTSPPISK